MNAPVSVPLGEFNDCILASQYNDMVKRRSRILEGEPRLLWAVLEEAIRSYLSNMKCLTANQCSEFEEVRHWFCPPQG